MPDSAVRASCLAYNPAVSQNFPKHQALHCSISLILPMQEEEDGSEDDAECKTQFTVTVKPELNMLGFLDQLDEGGDTFISPVDELSPSRNSTDMRLSNLHAATM